MSAVGVNASNGILKTAAEYPPVKQGINHLWAKKHSLAECFFILHDFFIYYCIIDEKKLKYSGKDGVL
ncbi:hypothetical protein SDC9_201594 [bioreactor metagenome]|uniref:Uncharacterized protein n=1 Tax=bioreactor metagenome TaxID=1076179 RepID=A0A645IRE1_9ZZZZ|nr:hypothetical protein [Erysipelotrichaceae bacterium]